MKKINGILLAFSAFFGWLAVHPAFAAPLDCTYDAPFLADDGWGLAFLCKNVTEHTIEGLDSWKGEYFLDGRRRVFLRDVPFRFKRPLEPGEQRRLRLVLEEKAPAKGAKIHGAALKEIFLHHEEKEEDTWWLRAPLPMDSENSLILWGCRDMIRSKGDGVIAQIRFLGTVINNDPSLTLVALKDAVFFFGDADREETMRLRRHSLIKPVGPGERLAFNVTVPIPAGMRVTRFGWKKATLILQEKIQ